MQGVIKWIGCVDDRPEPLAGLELVILSLRIKLLEIMYLFEGLFQIRLLICSWKFFIISCCNYEIYKSDRYTNFSC